MKESSAARAAKESTLLKLVPREGLFDRIRDSYESVARRAFEMFEAHGGVLGRDLEDWFRAESELLHPVHIEVTDSGDSLRVRAEVPGFAVKDLEVSVEPERLTISGKRETQEESKKGGKVIYSERCSDEILRVIDLPAAVDASKVMATLKDGVLDLVLRKAAPGKRTNVELKSG